VHVHVTHPGLGVQMNTPEQFTEHVHVQFSSCSVHLFLADHEHPPYVHVQFMFSSHLRPESDFLRYPEGQTTNVLFLEILTRATPHASCIHLSRARTPQSSDTPYEVAPPTPGTSVTKDPVHSWAGTPQRTKLNTGTPSGDEKISGNRADHPHILE
jgi:hypothetical protein